MKGQMGWDLLGSKGAGIFLFIEKLDSTHPKAVVIEVELLGIIDGVTDFDPLTDIGGGDLVERTFEADGGIVIDDPFVPDEKDLIQLLSGEPSDQAPAYGGVISVDGSLFDPGVKFMVIIVLKPQSEGIVELLQSHPFLENGEEPFSDCSKQTFYLSTGGAVIGFGMDERDAGLGAASSQQIRGERRRVIAVKPFRDSVGQEGLLEDDGQGADRFGGVKGMTDHHTGVVIEDGAEDGFGRAIGSADLGAMHEIRDPEIVDVIHFVGLAHIGPILKREPSLLFNYPEQGIVVNRRLSQQILIPKLFIEFLYRERGMGFTFDLNALEQILPQAFGSACVGAVFGFERIKASFTVLPKPCLQGGDTDLPQAVAGELVLDLSLFSEVFVLSPCGFGQHRADELIAFEGNLFSNLFVHGLFLLCGVFDHQTTMTMKPMINPNQDRLLARLCTIALRTRGPKLPTAVGQNKGEDFGWTTPEGF